MLAQDALDRVGEHLDGITSARPARGEQDQPSVRFASGETFGSEGSEVLHVVGDHGTALGHSGGQDQAIAPAGEVTAVCHGLDVMAALRSSSAIGESCSSRRAFTGAARARRRRPPRTHAGTRLR